jgi:hypothetical protein
VLVCVYSVQLLPFGTRRRSKAHLHSSYRRDRRERKVEITCHITERCLPWASFGGYGVYCMYILYIKYTHTHTHTHTHTLSANALKSTTSTHTYTSTTALSLSLSLSLSHTHTHTLHTHIHQHHCTHRDTHTYKETHTHTRTRVRAHTPHTHTTHTCIFHSSIHAFLSSLLVLRYDWVIYLSRFFVVVYFFVHTYIGYAHKHTCKHIRTKIKNAYD